ncbi:MAG: aminotransferase class I/II-fold pyridoxal phosphate-dependent enzyme [Bacteroidales bacterium]|jgi:aspartate/methionine/tyrosine aminotransferase|nr:aminotransferase class I/II-fold pyridoxal phosphate-dependent enzyme [Bacteroidales bacterium]
MAQQQAIALNEIIQKENPAVLAMLSEKGKNIYFPKGGILAQGAQAKGKNINATIGEAIADNGKSMYFSEFDKYLNVEVENIYPYAPSFGRPDLRAVWKKLLYVKNPSLGNQELSLPVVTNALTHAISMAAFMFTNEGDTVILPDLFWENYELLFCESNNAKIETFNSFKNGGFDVEAFAAALNAAKGDKIITLLNFPNNPTGYTPTCAEAEALQKAVLAVAQKGKKVVVLTDDAYFGLVYEQGIFEESIFTKFCNLHENVLAVKLDGATKEDYVWGFRVGFMTYGIKGGTPALYEALEAKTAGAVRGNISNGSNLSQSLLVKLYNAPEYASYKAEKYAILKNRYTTLRNALKAKNLGTYYDALPYNSGYFMCVKVKPEINAEEVRKLLLEKYSTGVIVFGDLIRIAYSAVPEDKMQLLVNNLYAACEEIAGK